MCSLRCIVSWLNTCSLDRWNCGFLSWHCISHRCFCRRYHACNFIGRTFRSLFPPCRQQSAIPSSFTQLAKLGNFVVNVAVVDASLRKVLAIRALTVVLFHYCFNFLSHLPNTELIRILKAQFLVKCGWEALLLIDKLMCIFSIEASDKRLWHLVLPRFHPWIRVLSNAPADVLAVVVIFGFAGGGLLRILVGTERAVVV